MNKKRKTNVLIAGKNLLLVFIGTAILAFGTAVFIVPFELISGGIAGMAIIIEKLIPTDKIPIDAIIAILTWGLFALGLFTLGGKFALKTLTSTALYPPLFSLFFSLVSPDVLGGYFYLQGSDHIDMAYITASICGGALVGVGCALSFLGGGSTGGTDIISIAISKHLRNVRPALVIFIVDGAITLFGVFVIKNMIYSLLGILSAFICAYVIEKILKESKKRGIVLPL